MSNGMTQAYRDATLTEHNQLRRTIVQASDMIEVTRLLRLAIVLLCCSFLPALAASSAASFGGCKRGSWSLGIQDLKIYSHADSLILSV